MMALVLCLAGILGIGTTTAYAAGEQAEVYPSRGTGTQTTTANGDTRPSNL